MSSVFDGLPDIFTGVLGRAVTVTPTGQSARSIRAAWVARSIDDLGVLQQRPAIHARSADVSDVQDGDSIVVEGKGSFVARERRPDGQGMTTIHLEEA